MLLRRRIARALVICILMGLAGCAVQEPAKIKEEVIKSDPSFSQILAKKEQIDKDISELRTTFTQERAALEVKIAGIRAEITRKKEALERQVSGLKSDLNPQRETIGKELKALETGLKERERTLKSLCAMEEDVKRLLGKVGSAEEKAKWEDTLPALSGQIKNLNDEIRALKEKINLLRTELQLLRQ